MSIHQNSLESLESRRLFNVGDLNLAFGGGNGRILFPSPATGSLQMSLRPSRTGSLSWPADRQSRTPSGSNVWMPKEIQTLSFGSGGVVTQTISNLVSTYGISAQSDGKFVVVGTTTTGGFVARFTSSGKLDTAFGTHGVVLSGSYLHGVTILPVSSNK